MDSSQLPSQKPGDNCYLVPLKAPEEKLKADSSLAASKELDGIFSVDDMFWLYAS